MKKIILASVLSLVLLVVFGLDAISPVVAQEKHKQAYTIPGKYRTYITQNTLDVKDVPGHQIRIYELHTVFPADWPHKTAGLRPVKAIQWGVSDYVNWSGRHYGYEIVIMENGDRTYSKFEGTTYTTLLPQGKVKSTFSGTGTITGGTGKLRGIRGTSKYTGIFDPTKGLNEATFEGEYWME